MATTLSLKTRIQKHLSRKMAKLKLRTMILVLKMVVLKPIMATQVSKLIQTVAFKLIRK
ncbi:hypothetical protein SMU40_06915 [Streptococcus mutans 15VF2]|nr:hypothetical protein SMU40_06915 [Streptococcus mutans 15VF2]